MAFDLIAQLGVSPEGLVLIITFLSSLIFFAKDFRIGSLLLFLLILVETIVVQAMINANRLFTDLNYFIYALLIAFVLLVLSLLFSLNKEVYVQ